LTGVEQVSTFFWLADPLDTKELEAFNARQAGLFLSAQG
jgi:hypothetical protein